MAAGRRGAWPLALAACFALGAFLRLYALPAQILLDDEWHSLNFVLGKPLAELFLRHGLGANSIPLNVANGLLLRLGGWSELALRAPSVLCGLAALALFPPVVAKLLNRRSALLFAFLLAVSPCVIFYARLVRPYAMVLFFGFGALLLLARWLQTGERRLLAAYAVAAFLAVYYNLYAVIPVLVPAGALVLARLLGVRGLDRARPWDLVAAAAGVLALSAAFLAPAHLANPWWLRVHGADRATLGTFTNYLGLLSGTGRPALVVLFVGLALWGTLLVFRENPGLGIVLAAPFPVFLAYTALTTQDAVHAAIQSARYSIALFPAAFCLVARGLDGALALARTPGARAGARGAAVALAGLLLWAGPLRTTYAMPNNFTNHSAFQDSYAPMDWSRSRVRDLTPLPTMEAAGVPAFYRELDRLGRVDGIIEFPMLVGDPLNLYYFYQHVHGRPVAGGYVPQARFPQLPSKDDHVYQDTPVDYVMSRAAALYGDRIAMRNLAPVTDLARLRRERPGWLIVVHRDLLGEMFPGRPGGPPGGAEPLAAWLIGYLGEHLGAPVHADGRIAVWRVPPGGAARAAGGG